MPESTYALFKVTASVLTPLHIGSGRELLNEYDYSVFKKQTWRINDTTLLDAQDVDDPALADRLASIPPAQLLKDADYIPDSPFFRYVIKGTPRSQAAGAVLREQIKDSFDRLYLPGSSLKGALRTALGWYAWGQKQLKPEMAELGTRREWAAQNYEHTLFGPTPNKDALRAMQVSDSAPLGADRMIIVNAIVLGGAGGLEKSIPVELEAIRPDTVFTLTIKVDLALYSDWARKAGLNLAGLEWMLQLPAVLQARARQRVDEEVRWYESQPSAGRVLAFYRQLAAARLEPNQALVQLGWGTGWDGMTFGSRLRTNPAFIQQVVAKFRLSRGQGPVKVFPKSRRTVVSFNVDPSGRRTATPVGPLGWMLLTFEPLREIPAEWQRLVKPLTIESAPPQPAPTPTRVPVPAQPAPGAQPRPGPKREVIQLFTALPQPGDRFYGEVLSVDNAGCYLELPGLDPDSQVIGWIAAPQPRPREGARLLCEVVEVKPDPAKKGLMLVICQKGS